MASVWAIEEGDYSDYHVVGVFSSKENAEKILALREKENYSLPTIAEWVLDPCIPELNSGLTTFRVVMWRDGTTEEALPTEVSFYSLRDKAVLWKRSTARAYQGSNYKPDCIYHTVWAEDETHAVKIMNEIRTQMIANGEWD